MELATTKLTLLIRNFTFHKLKVEYLNKTAEQTLAIDGFKGRAEISLVVVGNTRMKSLNRKYRNINKATDVLSFGNSEESKRGCVKFIHPPNHIAYLGEIFICYPQAQKQAKEEKCSIDEALSVLLIHGILHLLGYDHKKDCERMIMEEKEKAVLESLKGVTTIKCLNLI